MSERSRTKYIILGMLSIEPSSGYDITQSIKSSTAYFWSESEGQIYPTLAKCVANGLATCKEDPESNNRTRKIYTITPKGEKVLNEWLEKKPQESLVRNEFLLKLFFAKNISKEKILAHLETFIREEKASLDAFEKINKQLIQIEDPHKPYWLASLNYGIATTKAALEWAQNTLQVFKKS
ncbi:MAG: virulence activator alpha family protein [Burkholderiales bacterium]|jgi:DNA-binding PadR family transcriptional regulator|nr:virulence activator alpha family protein [Burkholderiales bacterium]